MDRRIERKIWTPKRLGWLIALAVLTTADNATRNAGELINKLTIDTVRRGSFQEYLLPDAELRGAEAGGLEVRAAVDAFDVPRLRIGQPATLEIDGFRHPLEIVRIGPPGPRTAEVDLRFIEPPKGLASGTSISLRIDLGEPAEVLLLRRGGFFQETGGQWVFRLDTAGGKAVRRPIRLGRQNPESYEVLDGLAEGDRVIISTYSHLTDAQELVLTGEP